RYVLAASLSDPFKLMAFDGILLKPLGFNIQSYKAVAQNPNILVGYKNTIIIVVAGTAVNILMTLLAAYGLSRKNLGFKRAITVMIIITMYFSGGLIPTYLNIRQLGMYDSLLSLIIPGAISTTNMIILRTAISGVPSSLEESAKLDGASHLQILFRIILPLVMPTIAVLILYYGVGHWNSWFSAAIYLKSREKFPLQLFLREMIINSSMDAMMLNTQLDDKASISETIKYAVIIVSTVPILLLYPFLQKYFVKGVMVGSLKG
ncbi:MAG TPA: sugar ABC transporter permease, partial [Ruminococcaceae bacterium]|nr:sugar ABC transporter permease [Oscillospiraceae bacterium]